MKPIVWRRPNTAEDGPLLVAMRTEKGYEYVTEASFMNGVPVDGECLTIRGECVAVADMPEFPEESEILPPEETGAS